MKYMLICLLMTSSLFAQDFVFDKEKGRAVPTYIGQLKFFKGKIFKKNDQGVQDVGPGERFKKDDILMTDEASFARIQIVDETLISIGPKSELKFNDLDFVDKNDRKLDIGLIKGQITGNVKNKAKNAGDIQFRTKYSSMGVRGTYILMNQQTLNGFDVVQYALTEGKAEVTDSQNQKTEMVAGDSVVMIQKPEQKIAELEKQKLDEAEFKRLKAAKMDEEKEFKPFLPYIGLDEVNKHFEASNTTTTGTGDSTEAKREDKKPHWEENLKKLNEKLKEDNKKN